MIYINRQESAMAELKAALGDSLETQWLIKEVLDAVDLGELNGGDAAEQLGLPRSWSDIIWEAA